MPFRRCLYLSVALALVCGGFVWNLIFDLWLGQVERQYLWEQARHELGYGPSVSLQGMMRHATREGAWVATGWAIVVVAAILGAAWYGYRQGRAAEARRMTAPRA
jgi:hypothetical protein